MNADSSCSTSAKGMTTAPMSTAQKCGSITGSARKAKDSSAELYNAIQSWNSLHASGMDILYEILNLKIGNEYSSELQARCDKLEIVCHKMEEIVKKLKIIQDNFQGLKKLEELRGNASIPIFQTWTLDEFVSLAKKVYESYEKDFKVKITVKENIAHCERQEELMLYSALWCHEPYVDESLTTYLDLMLRESGHK